jgi:hypothetical protein
MDEQSEASEAEASEVEGEVALRPAPASGLLKHWRWFAMEFSVVALGVLTALGAEQAIATYHANGKAATAQESLNDEMRQNRIMAAGFTRIIQCADRQLTVISNAIGENDQEHLRRLVAASSLAPPRPWSDAAWQSVLASDVIDRFDEEERLSYSGSYYILGRLRGYQERAVDAWWRLDALTRNASSSSSNLAEAQMMELAELRAALAGIETVVLLMNPEQGSSIFEQLDPEGDPITEDLSDPGLLRCEEAADTLEAMSAET